ncbi:gephyrin-like molybdotransferase Glp [Candidatus Omnitrophota bacterium]
MLKVEDALKTIVSGINILPSEEVSLTDSLDRVLREDIYADCDVPLLDNSAMDGYALKSSDTRGASKTKPRTLEVIHDLKAGYVAKEVLKDNQAIRIMTGAPIPDGADSVIIVEETEKEGKDRARIFKEVKLRENIRERGEDIKKGEKVIKKNTLLNSAHIGLLASLGKTKIRVTKKPKVAILATGDEVIDVGEKLEPGKLRSSNTYTLYSQVLKCGGIPKNLGIAKDNPEELENRLKQGLDCDLIVTSGGVSVGDYDLVKPILAKIGTDMKFWKVAMRPGKPLVFGRLGDRFIFGLPGNPVSSMISFEVFVRPTILKLSGQELDKRCEVDAILEEDVKKKKDLRYFLRAETRWEDGTYHTRTTGPQGSGILKSMALANSLIVLPEEKDYVKKGSKVKVRFLD